MAKILFVSNDEELAYVCQVVLEARGHRVELVSDAEQALARLESFAPQLLVVEHRLAAGFDGAELIAALRERLHVHTPAVLISGARDAAEVARAAGADACVPKPFASSELLAAIERLAGTEERRIA